MSVNKTWRLVPQIERTILQISFAEPNDNVVHARDF